MPHSFLEEQPAIDIADTDHPDKPAPVNDGDAPEVLETHVRGGFQNRIEGRHRHGILAHDIFDFSTKYLGVPLFHLDKASAVYVVMNIVAIVRIERYQDIPQRD